MKIIFLGATAFSAEMLQCLLETGIEVSALFMIPQEFDLRKKGEQAGRKYENSNYADLGAIAAQHRIPCHTVDSRDGRTLGHYAEQIEQIAPDLILVLGWYYVVPRKIRDLAVYGAIGIHASLLPEYAGGSPLVWALINGEQRTGITMFRFADGIDDGDILAQKEIPISIEDTIGSLYEKVTVASKEMLVAELVKIRNKTHNFTPQDTSRIHPLPIRTPEDGLVDWNQTAMSLYNFVRAQTKPYPCAFSFLGSRKIKFISLQVPGDMPVPDSGEPGKTVNSGDSVWIFCMNGAVRPCLVEIDGVEVDFSTYCRDHSLVGQVLQSAASE